MRTESQFENDTRKLRNKAKEVANNTLKLAKDYKRMGEIELAISAMKRYHSCMRMYNSKS